MGITLREAKFLEGDLILIRDGSIFDVKGLIHPPSKVVAFPRFILDSSGDREHRGCKYRKIYNISARFEFLEQNFPQFIVYDSVFDEKLCEVPMEKVKNQYKPANRLRELRHCTRLDDLEKDALNFVEILKGYGNIPWTTIGISGSLLVKLHKPDSDIDPIIYGSKNCRKVYEALKSLTQDSKSLVKTYTTEDLQKLFQFRVKDTRMTFKDFEKTESRKVLQGKFKNRDYFLRFVKDWSEIEAEYGVVCYKNVGYAKIEAVIEDDSEAIFTPCTYKINNVETCEGVHFPIEEISSFRGRFCEHARTGEAVIAQGKVERVTDNRQNREYFRLLLGNKPSDFMTLV
jgi:predicted nucleotidyltransferase